MPSSIGRRPSRRTFLGATSAGLAALLRPMIAEAQGTVPKRLVVIHRPCGTIPAQWFPIGSEAAFSYGRIMKPLEPWKDRITVLRGVTCPRDRGWQGDQHGAGLMTMLTGTRPMAPPGRSLGGDPNTKGIVASGKSIDQLLLERAPALKGGRVDSLQLVGTQAAGKGDACRRVMSWAGPNLPLFGESRPEAVFARLFGSTATPAPASGAPDVVSKAQRHGRSVLDFLNADLRRLQGRVPAGQKGKLEAHLEAIREIERALPGSAPSSAACGGKAPAAIAGVDDDIHLNLSRAQLSIARLALQCDVTRLLTFSFADSNSELHFKKILGPAAFSRDNGHHGITHSGWAEGKDAALAQIDEWYSQRLGELLEQLVSVREGADTLLDHTLVVYLSECGVGDYHTVDDMPVLLIGGSKLGLRGGRSLNLGGRSMNDVWTSVANAFGVDLPRFGDAERAKGPVAGLFG